MSHEKEGKEKTGKKSALLSLKENVLPRRPNATKREVTVKLLSLIPSKRRSNWLDISHTFCSNC